jgi:UDP-3-O-[3-hydroxymyristoyl] glucosamine N-acyltransferase
LLIKPFRRREPLIKKTVRDLAALVSGEVSGDGGIDIRAATSAASGESDTITFAENDAAIEAALASDVGAVIVARSVETSKSLICVDNPRMAFVRIANALHPEERPAPGIDPSATVDPSVSLGEDVHVGAGAVVQAEAVLSARVVIGPGSVVSKGCVIGEDSRLHPRVVLYPGITIGARVVIHAGAVIGADGFGYVDGPEGKVKFPQLGTVVVEDDVEIGSNTTIDRAALDETRIGAGTKIDNLVMIAHNVVIGRRTIITAQTGISGTSTIGSEVILAGQVGIGDHVTIADGVIVGAQGGVPTGKRLRPGIYWGTPARPLDQVKKRLAWVGLIGRLRERVADLEARLKGDEN